MHLSQNERAAKLTKLAAIEGFAGVDHLLRHATYDSVNPGICIRPEYEYTCKVEPDQDRGWCEACGTQSAQSVLIPAELV